MNDSVAVFIRNESPHPLPAYQSEHAAGMDLHAFLKEEKIIFPNGRTLIPTGLYMALPEGFQAEIRPRSGLAYYSGITVLNSPGTIDADYRGEINVLLINLSDQHYTIKDGDRVAQLIITSYRQVIWHPTKTLPNSLRGKKGFGSSGNN